MLSFDFKAFFTRAIIEFAIVCCVALHRENEVQRNRISLSLLSFILSGVKTFAEGLIP